MLFKTYLSFANCHFPISIGFVNELSDPANGK
jgi:hypothetical protein